MRNYISNIAIALWSLVIIKVASICNITTVTLSEFEEEMFHNFKSGNGNVELSNSDSIILKTMSAI